MSSHTLKKVVIMYASQLPFSFKFITSLQNITPMSYTANIARNNASNDYVFYSDKTCFSRVDLLDTKLKAFPLTVF